MQNGVVHPRALFVFRLFLYTLVAAVLGAMIVALIASVGFLAVVGGLVALLSAEVTAGPVLALGGFFILSTLVVALGVVLSARHVDARVTASDRRPDPLDVLREEYVNGFIDEPEFEYRVERLFDDEYRALRTAVMTAEEQWEYA